MRKKKLQRTYSAIPTHWSTKQLPDFDVTATAFLVSSMGSYLTKSQLESGRKVVSRITKKHKPRPKFQVVPVFLTPVTRKSAGSRMGKGKGSIHTHVCRLRGNSILFKFNKVSKPVLMHLFRKVALKLPIQLKYYSMNCNFFRY